MNIEFEISKFPDRTESYHVTAFTEGTLTISFNNTIFLRLVDCLLVEFAIVLQKWIISIEGGAPRNLYYASMDEEEEPIFALTFDDSRGKYLAESCWSETNLKYDVSQEEALQCASSYIEELKGQIANLKSFNIGKMIEEAVKNEII